ncbi:MAG: amidase family protein [Arenicellales bacterium]|nr:amidase family protein [Arenicellales bacterium]
MSDLCNLTACDARQKIETKEISPLELVDACIGRIEAVNHAVNAIVATCYERAREEARLAEKVVMNGSPLGALHGLPLGVKDLNVTAGLRTTFGSELYADWVPESDERIIAALRAAGAIVLGKTNTPEFGAGANTINRVYGATGNPFDVKRTCGGSSGGSAVALACGMVPLATGSDTGGSLRTPASFCGITSHRGTPGLVPSDRRTIGLSTYSVQGPMARNVHDTALMLSAMAAHSTLDPLSGPVDASVFANLPSVDLNELKVAWSSDLGVAPVDNQIATVFRERVNQLGPAFASCTEHNPELQTALETFWIIRGVHFLASHLDAYNTTPDKLGPNVSSNVKAALEMTSSDIGWAMAEQTRLYRNFQRFFEDYDLLLCPGNAVPPFPLETLYCDEINGQKLSNYIEWLGIASAITLTGHPVTMVPIGLDHTGAPIGVQVVGPKRHSDAFTLACAAEIELLLQTDPLTKRPIPTLEHFNR